MPSGEVHWHEGMFLRQHHFLTEHRQLVRLLQLDQKWALHHNWGLRSLTLSHDALSNFRFSVSALKARLGDGTLIEVPEDGPLPDLDLKPALESSPKVTVHLAIPVLKSNQPNVASEGPADQMRYYVITQQLEDENLGVNPQPIPIRRLNLKLLLSTQDRKGYQTIPIARIEKVGPVAPTPQLDPTYFPPVLACDAWHDLKVGVLEAVYHGVGRKIEKLATQAVNGKLRLESTEPDVILIFAQLRVLNEAYATLTNLAFLDGVHPLDAYQELCRLVGSLAIFKEELRRPPEIPRYDHDDLWGCFNKVREYLDELLSIVPEPSYHKLPFVGHGPQMQVRLEQAWLNQKAPLYIGVTSPLGDEKCVEQIQNVDMKVGSPDRIDPSFTAGGGTLTFDHVSNPPKVLPRGMTYFQINRRLQPREWDYVEASKRLAIRFNEYLVDGDIDHKEEVKLKKMEDDAEGIPFEFTLYVLTKVDGAQPPASGRR